MKLKAQNSSPAALLIIVLLTLSGCSWRTPAPTQSYEEISIDIDESTVSGRAAVTATKLVGTRYRYGGSTPSNGFDCSGLVYYSYQQAGKQVPRTAAEQFSTASRISLQDAQPGDLLFFSSRRKVDHVAIYLGDNKFVHAPSSGKTVTTGTLTNPYYEANFVGAGRL